MKKNTTQPTAPASGEVKISADNQPQPQLPREYQPRIESGKELKTFWDEKELLRHLPICRRTAFSWIKQGKLPCIKINRRKIFHAPSVEAALLRLQRGGNVQ